MLTELSCIVKYHFLVNLFKGLWLGIVSALVVQVLSLSIITLVTNWDKEVIRKIYYCVLCF